MNVGKRAVDILRDSYNLMQLKFVMLSTSLSLKTSDVNYQNYSATGVIKRGFVEAQHGFRRRVEMN